MIGWGAPSALRGATPEQVAEAQRQLARIGIGEFAETASGQPEEHAAESGQLCSTPTTTFTDLARALDGAAGDLPAEGVLDVRTNNEFRSSHASEAVHVPLHELTRRLDEVLAGAVRVRCGSGYRATAAASPLAAGRPAVIVEDEFDTAGEAGVPQVAAA